MSGNLTSGRGIGPPEFSVRTTTGVERSGSATDRNSRRNSRQERHHREQERRDHNPPNPQRRRLYDLLFDEVDQFDGLDERQRTRLKENLRSHLSSRAPPPPAAPSPVHHDEDALAEALLKDPAAPLPVDPEHIVQAAITAAPELDPEAARLAEQLRDCLARNTDRARKVAVYLHLLLTLEGAFRPHMVVDV
ncbi:hypothetical protein HUE56_16160 [Azospirillum oryzae]|uniref:Uncharacterized protein n=1 Tax=Azospirillum oryzae TaxID=286727 RepID=A0A6N1AJI6_9PROT|nr:hypothetical protein [Azospirillum oryzae]KAA0590128.1 hypothetical protein FZ938_11150 [Azospirillum oryzae]QKS51965.1 hypothetical protein HUE56_16160 [Azospirillum oryzae]GLR78007.1 hypothetical protein GCM10007856_06760 [Azospirillum oryzae]